jgi:hypothetical protein
LPGIVFTGSGRATFDVQTAPGNFISSVTGYRSFALTGATALITEHVTRDHIFIGRAARIAPVSGTCMETGELRKLPMPNEIEKAGMPHGNAVAASRDCATPNQQNSADRNV